MDRSIFISQIRKSLKGLIPLILFFISFCANAQKSESVSVDWLTSEQFKIEKGLSQNSVYCILQDKNGFMWFGTWDGLNRYDGIGVRIFNVDFENPNNGLPNQTIKSLCEDRNGNLWIGTEKGLCKLSGKQPDLQHYLSDGTKNQLSNDTILSLAVDSQNKLWIGTADKLNLYIQDQDSILSFSFGQNRRKTHIINDLIAHEDLLYIATQNGLLELNTIDYSYIYHAVPKTLSKIYSDTLWCLAIDSSQTLWVGADRGLLSFDLKNRNWKSYPNLSNRQSVRIMSVHFDRSGQLWIGTAGRGLKLYHDQSSSFIQILDENDPLSAEDFVYDLHEDQNGNIWYGSAWKGVGKVNRSKYSFAHIKNNSRVNSNRQLNNNKIWSIIEVEPNLFFIATDNGINIYDRVKQRFQYLSKENGLLHRKVRYLLHDRKNKKIWISYYQGGASSYKLENKSFTHYPAPTYFPKALVWSMVQDQYENIWFSTEKGVYQLNPQTNEIEAYLNQKDDSNSLSHDIVYTSYKDKKNRLWFGTQNGLNLYDKKQNHFTRFKKSKDFPISINKIFSIFEDKDGIFWIGTIGGGLNSFDPEKNVIEYYTQQTNGLANNVIYGILEDLSGNLWLTTNYGLSQFIPSEKQFINFDVKDGIQGYEFNLGAYCKSQSGEILIGGMNGINVFHPQDIIQNMEAPLLVVNSFRVMNEERAIFLKDRDSIVLKHNDNFFEFGFAALDFTNPSKNIYSYRLENFESSWNVAGIDKPFAEYTKVDPGSYVFHLKGTNSDGIWNEKGIRIFIQIKPPWYSTLLFRIIAISLLAFVVWIFIRRRILFLRKKHLLEKQMIDLERQALRLQMNPHFIFNTLYSIQGYILNNEKDIAVEFLAKFSKLMRLVLNNSNQDFILLSDEIEQLQLYLDIEQERFDNCFSYIINLGPFVDDQSMSIPPMLIQPYAENAIIHGFLHKKEKGKLIIDIVLKDDLIHITVQDDGVGREASAEKKKDSGLKHDSKGMLITKKRLEILNLKHQGSVEMKIKDLFDEQNNAIGTKISLSTIYQEI